MNKHSIGNFACMNKPIRECLTKLTGILNLLNIYYAFLILRDLKMKFSDGYMAESDTEFWRTKLLQCYPFI